MNESLYFIPLLLPQSGPLLCIGVCCVAEVDLGKSPTGLDRPTAEMPLLGSALRGSSLLKSFYEALVKAFVCGLRWV